jgi:DNA-binding transcriptional LysR family regulator
MNRPASNPPTRTRSATPPAPAEAAIPALSTVSLRALEIFVGVAQTGSMSGVAERLGLSQSAVSQAIRGFEDTVGARLFDRSVRPPALTLVGATVLKHAAAIVHHKHELERAIRLAEDQPLPLLRIGMVDSFAATAGPMLIDQLRNVAAQWSVASGAAETKIQALVDRRVDFIVTSDQSPVPDDFLVLPVLSEPYFLALPSSFTGEVRSLKQLAGALDLIRYGQQLHIARQIERYLEETGVTAPLRYQFDTVDAVIAMVASGLGWTVTTPLAFLKAAAHAPRIRCEKLPGAAIHRRVAVVARQGEGRSVAALIQEAAIDVLRRQCIPLVHQLLPSLSAAMRLGEDKPAQGASRRRKRS